MTTDERIEKKIEIAAKIADSMLRGQIDIDKTWSLDEVKGRNIGRFSVYISEAIICEAEKI